MFNSMPVGTPARLSATLESEQFRCSHTPSLHIPTSQPSAHDLLRRDRGVPAQAGTLAIRQARNIKPAVRKIRISVAIAENTTTVAPLALVERRDFLRRRLLEHDPPHRTMVKIAQRKTCVLGSGFMVAPRKNPAWLSGAERKGRILPGTRAETKDPRWPLPQHGRSAGGLWA